MEEDFRMNFINFSWKNQGVMIEERKIVDLLVNFIQPIGYDIKNQS